MTQLGLFNLPPREHRPPHNRSDTSRRAAELIRDCAPSMCARVLAYVRDQGDAGATNEEIARSLGMRLQSVCGRIGELKAEGYVRDSGKRRLGSSGIPAKVWWAVRR